MSESHLMMSFQPAVPDKNWLEPDELYLARGRECEIDRPLFQGDVFTSVPLPAVPKKPPSPGRCEIDMVESTVMVIPHPCQCYFKDKVRPFITVAPVAEVPNYENFGEDRTGSKDRFALPDLRADGSEEFQSYVANFGRIISVPQAYLATENRIACLSHMGLGLLSKRFIAFQSRVPSRLAEIMAFTQDQWNESFAMQAWVRRHRELKGFNDWWKSPQSIASLGSGEPVKPCDFATSALEELIKAIEES